MPNPALTRTFGPSVMRAGARGTSPAEMTVAGTVDRTALLLVVLVASAAAVWRIQEQRPELLALLAGVGVVGGLAVGLATAFKPDIARATAGVYAILEGVAVGSLSAAMDALFPGIAVQAAIATFATLGAMLLAYRSGILRATDGLTKFVTVATLAIVVGAVVVVLLLASGVAIPVLDSRPVAIAVSIVIIVVAALNLILDFGLIEGGAASGLPKSFEWYGAFSLLVTLVWLYVEILRFLAEVLGDVDD
jgi:uncharacterized YccA/Bax inhibitor family protein